MTQNGKYVVSCRGDRAPSVYHETYKDALNEANRLASLPNNLSRSFEVLKVMTYITSKIEVVVDDSDPTIKTTIKKQKAKK